MKYYKCIDIEDVWDKYSTIGKIYREDDKGNYQRDNNNYSSIAFIVDKTESKYFKEVSKLEYLKSINLKDKLIELANSDKYSIIINSIDDAIKLDKLFTILGHTQYINNPGITLEEWFDNYGSKGDHIGFSLVNRVTSEDRIIITIKELLDYV